MDSVQTSGGSFPVVKFLVGLALFCGGAIYTRYRYSCWMPILCSASGR